MPASLSSMGVVDAIELLLDKLKQTRSDGEFFESMNKPAAPSIDN
jgi:transcription termination factor Rho